VTIAETTLRSDRRVLASHGVASPPRVFSAFKFEGERISSETILEALPDKEHV
jgi:hypothetical protein